MAVSVPAVCVIVAEIALCLVLLALPWRILYGTQLPIVSLGTQSCFLLGTHDADALVLCPNALPRNHVVSLSKIQQSGERTVGWLFDALSVPAKSSSR